MVAAAEYGCVEIMTAGYSQGFCLRKLTKIYQTVTPASLTYLRDHECEILPRIYHDAATMYVNKCSTKYKNPDVLQWLCDNRVVAPHLILCILTRGKMCRHPIVGTIISSNMANNYPRLYRPMRSGLDYHGDGLTPNYPPGQLIDGGNGIWSIWPLFLNKK